MTNEKTLEKTLEGNQEEGRRELRDRQGKSIPPYLHRYCKRRHNTYGGIYYATPHELRLERQRRGY